MAFLAQYGLDILLGLISAGALAFCKYLSSQVKNYKQLLDNQKDEQVDTQIDKKLEPIYQELEEIRAYSRTIDTTEKAHVALILASYRYRLIQLCKEFLRQGYMTPTQYEQLSEFYRIYEGLGGNGQAKEYYEKATKLEIRSN